MAKAGQDTRAQAESVAADREVVISRGIDAPRELVFEAFTEVRHLSRWWGPEGLATAGHERLLDVRNHAGVVALSAYEPDGVSAGAGGELSHGISLVS